MYEDFELEIEAIQSMYDTIVIDPKSLSSSSSCYRIIELTLTPRVLASSSFVEITIQIHVPLSYVTQSSDNDNDSYIPKVIIKRTSGLADEGKQLLLNLQKLHSSFLPGIHLHYDLYYFIIIIIFR